MAIKSPIAPKYLYWCHTDLPEDYDFYYGTSDLQVRRKYDRNMQIGGIVHVIAHQVCEIPPALLKELKVKNACGVASNELILRSGIELLHEDWSAFRYNGKIYKEEGFLDSKISMAEGLHVYLFKVKEKRRYKIGYTKDISRRLRELSRPDQMEIVNAIRTPDAKRLESELIGYFERFQIFNEYIELDVWGAILLIAIFDLYALEFHNTDVDHQRSDMFEYYIGELKLYVDSHKLHAEPSREIMEKVVAICKLVEAKLIASAEKFLADYHKKVFG
ncbi:MAG: GIY-YIG nuclease family protein [Chitinophagaceae bacterium]|nr:GIY-YIG nuclease family protein [Chitinophagaceae bacterium]